MIQFSESVFLALDLDGVGAVFSPVKGRGGAHIMTVPSAERPGVDVLAFADAEGKVYAACGSVLTATNLVPGAVRAMCGKCEAFVSSAEYAVQADRVMEILAREDRAANVAARKEAVKREKARLADQRAKRSAVAVADRPAKGSGKKGKKGTSAPAVVVNVAADAGPAGPADSKPADVTASGGDVPVLVCAVTGAQRIKPVEGTDRDGIVGVCPECRTEVKLTDAGNISKHTVANAPVPAPKVSATKSVPVLDDGSRQGDPRDAQKRRENESDGAGGELNKSITSTRKKIEKMREEGAPEGADKIAKYEAKLSRLEDKLSRLLRERADNVSSGAEFDGKAASQASAPAAGSRGESMIDGSAMVAGTNLPPVQPKRGYLAAAGTMALNVGPERPDKSVTEIPVKGGRYGYLTEAEYAQLSRTHQRRYWRHVATAKNRAKAARERIKGNTMRGNGGRA